MSESSFSNFRTFSHLLILNWIFIWIGYFNWSDCTSCIVPCILSIYSQQFNTLEKSRSSLNFKEWPIDIRRMNRRRKAVRALRFMRDFLWWGEFSPSYVIEIRSYEAITSLRHKNCYLVYCTSLIALWSVSIWDNAVAQFKFLTINPTWSFSYQDVNFPIYYSYGYIVK